MSKTHGHHDPLINGRPIAEYIYTSVGNECHHYGIDTLTVEQIAVVCSMLRMHTITAHAVGYDQSELHKPEERTNFHPEASSVGRFLRDSSRITLDRIEEAEL